jgi:hypothetical protein
VVTRTIRPDGETRLAVTAKDGAKYSSPQALLDSLVAGLSFDPLAFSRMKPGEQRELLSKLVGLDTSAIDAERARAYEQRTIENREVKRLDAELAGAPQHEGAPDAEVSVAALAEELRAAEEHQRKVAEADRAVEKLESQLQQARTHADAMRTRIAELKAEIAKLEERLQHGEKEVLPQLRSQLTGKRAAAETLRNASPDTSAIRAKLASAEAVNAQVRANRRRAELEAKRVEVAARSEALTKRIEELDAAKRAAIAGAAYPLPGLSVDDQGVLLNGVPFEQGSSAEQLRASVAIGLALNPTLRVLLVRDGSLLDSESMRLLAEMAAAADAQVWVEVVSDRGDIGVVIEDGAVQGTSAAAEAAAPDAAIA